MGDPKQITIMGGSKYPSQYGALLRLSWLLVSCSLHKMWRLYAGNVCNKFGIELSKFFFSGRHRVAEFIIRVITIDEVLRVVTTTTNTAP